VDEDIAD